jgi:hypothetical protein
VKWLPAAAALVLAGLLALAARSVLDLPRQVEAQSGPGLAARVVGAADDIRYRRSLRLAARAIASPRNAVRIRSQAETALALGPRTAQAANLLGALSLADAAADQSNGSKYAADAATAFREALGLDPASEDAKFDLELLLTLKPKAAKGSSAERTTPHGKRSRAGKASAPGTGY